MTAAARRLRTIRASLLVVGGCTGAACATPPKKTPTVLPVDVASVGADGGATAAVAAPPVACDADAGELPDAVPTTCRTALDDYCVRAQTGGFVSHVCETLPEAIANVRKAPWQAVISTCSGGYVVRTDDGEGGETLFFDRCRRLIGAYERVRARLFCNGTSHDMLAGRSNVGDCRVDETVDAKVPVRR
jgi:hypothetical protein